MSLVETMREVILKLRQENEQLQKGAQSNQKYMNLLKECKKLRKENAAVATMKEELEKRTDELKKATVRFVASVLFHVLFADE